MNAVHAVLNEHSWEHRDSYLANPLESQHFDDAGHFLVMLTGLVEAGLFIKAHWGGDDYLSFAHIEDHILKDRYTTDDAARIQNIVVLAAHIERRMAD